MDITSKSEFKFDPAPVAVPVDATGEAYVTPAAHHYQLGGLGLLDYVRAKLRVAVRLNQATAGGQITVKLSDGIADFAAVPVDLAGSLDKSVEVDLGQVSSTALMRVVVDVGTAADAATEAQVYTALECETPFITSSC